MLWLFYDLIVILKLIWIIVEVFETVLPLIYNLEIKVS